MKINTRSNTGKYLTKEKDISTDEFAALTTNGTVVTWGHSRYGGRNTSSVGTESGITLTPGCVYIIEW